VYYGRYSGPVDANVNEIAAWRFLAIPALEAELEANPERFTPWFKMEWAHIRHNFLDSLLRRTGTDG
jgi:isopentenyl-diphosphate delta-isomerase